jgi:hypothetical protein
MASASAATDAPLKSFTLVVARDRLPALARAHPAWFGRYKPYDPVHEADYVVVSAAFSYRARRAADARLWRCCSTLSTTFSKMERTTGAARMRRSRARIARRASVSSISPPPTTTTTATREPSRLLLPARRYW